MSNNGHIFNSCRSLIVLFTSQKQRTEAPAMISRLDYRNRIGAHVAARSSSPRAPLSLSRCSQQSLK